MFKQITMLVNKIELKINLVKARIIVKMKVEIRPTNNENQVQIFEYIF